jgi:Tfp pilus assembly protein FimT
MLSWFFVIMNSREDRWKTHDGWWSRWMVVFNGRGQDRLLVETEVVVGQDKVGQDRSGQEWIKTNARHRG